MHGGTKCSGWKGTSAQFLFWEVAELGSEREWLVSKVSSADSESMQTTLPRWIGPFVVCGRKEGEGREGTGWEETEAQPCAGVVELLLSRHFLSEARFGIQSLQGLKLGKGYSDQGKPRWLAE